MTRKGTITKKERSEITRCKKFYEGKRFLQAVNCYISCHTVYMQQFMGNRQ